MNARSIPVAIIGAGPAGLLLSWALRAEGIDSIVVENRPLDYLLGRIRAGVLEQGSVDTLTRLGLGTRLATEGMVHNGIYLQFGGERHHIDFAGLIGRTVTVYGQQEVVKDLAGAHEAAGSEIYYDASDVTVHDVDSATPRVTFTHNGEDHELTAGILVGADGFHGICRPAMPQLEVFERTYPFAWLGILANVAPSTDELIYAHHPDGFAMHSMRSPQVSRLYLQVAPDENVDDWSDARVWDALHQRLGVAGWSLEEGEVTEKSVLPMRSFVTSRLDNNRLFLVGDAGHIVPPTGAKGLNSAIGDVTMLAEAIVAESRGDGSLLASYGRRALDKQWRTQQFSQWMTELLHIQRDSGTSDFDVRAQLGRLDYVVHSEHAKRGLAEQYAGLPLDFGKAH